MARKRALLIVSMTIALTLPVIQAIPARAGSLFGPAVNYAVQTNPVDVATAAFRGRSDGRFDLAVAASNNLVSVLLGNGDGSFRSPDNYAVGTNPLGLAAGDFNRDGKLDLAVADQNSNSASVLLNTATPPVATPEAPAPLLLPLAGVALCAVWFVRRGSRQQNGGS